MPLKDVPLKGVYRTAIDSLIRDFYLPCLSQAKSYDRAVGFFSSSMLIEAGCGLSGLIRNGGKMRLVIGHPLSDDDWEAVRDGTRLQPLKELLSLELSGLLEKAGSERAVNSLQLLSWMVATGSIEIRFAFRRVGMYHEKIGVIRDLAGDVVVFHGSANESANALLPTRNFESLAVYRSWQTEVFQEYGQPFLVGFDDLWSNETPEVLTVDVPSDFYERLAKYGRDNGSTPPDLELEALLSRQAEGVGTYNAKPVLPVSFHGSPYALKSHQERALTRWAANSYEGILALATGAGKTITALHAATRFSQQVGPLVLVIAVPYQVLAEQWVDVMSQFSMRPVEAFYSQEHWISRLDTDLSALLAGASAFLSVVVVNDTLATNEFQERLARVPSNVLFFVGDECHHHSSSGWANLIPGRARFRLGLSATPWDPGRTQQKAALSRIYGPVVDEYSLADALRDGVLCSYTYHWIPCEFSVDESVEYERLSNLISSLYAQDPHGLIPGVQEQIRTQAARRTRLLGALENKSVQLRKLLTSRSTSPHTLFYCAEGRHPLQDSGSGQRVIDTTVADLASMRWKVARITASESVSERRRSLQAFDDGFVDAIAAIRVLDEGFDIPSCRTAFILASSNSYRQYVQRRGRVLRKAPGKSAADIYDFAAMPSSELLRGNVGLWRRQVASELTRIREFVALATNSVEQQITINRKLEELGLAGMYYEEAPISEESIYAD